MNNKVSIIIPVYNEQSTLPGVLRAVIKCKKANEVIVINDGSTDQSGEILKAFLSKSNKIKAINFNKNRTKAKALIAGVKKARGNIIFFLDSDIENLTPEVIDQTISLFFDRRCDCLLAQFSSGDKIKFLKFFDRLEFLVGNRIMRRADFLACLKDIPLEKSGMGIETALTIWLRMNHKKIAAVKMPGVIHPKIKIMKRGILKGIYQELLQQAQIVFAFVITYIRFLMKN